MVYLEQVPKTSCISYVYESVHIKPRSNTFNISFNAFWHCWTMLKDTEISHGWPEVSSIIIFNHRQYQYQCYASWTHVEQHFEHVQTSFNVIPYPSKTFNIIELGCPYKLKMLYATMLNNVEWNVGCVWPCRALNSPYQKPNLPAFLNMLPSVDWCVLTTHKIPRELTFTLNLSKINRINSFNSANIILLLKVSSK